MTLAAGARLGPYEVLAPLGAGGMGEVYRALDTRLDRRSAACSMRWRRGRGRFRGGRVRKLSPRFFGTSRRIRRAGAGPLRESWLK
jgi:serine/threonine protein kinase